MLEYVLACFKVIRHVRRYASAWLKFHYLGTFAAAILNNQPMGLYSAAVLVEDALRHGLRVQPIDVMRSSWPCTLEREDEDSLSLRLGLRYARGLRENTAGKLEAARTQRAFSSISRHRRSPHSRSPPRYRQDLVARSSHFCGKWDANKLSTCI
jgi:DNA polymerase III alpha subunit